MLDQTLENSINKLNKIDQKKSFLDQDETIIIENFLPKEILNKIVNSLPSIEDKVHRNYIPNHKKGGSISRYDLDKHIPVIQKLYRSKILRDFFEILSDRKLIDCPENDPHTYALYYYTEEGDHIGYHYDTSYYKDSRYTLLFGLEDNSSCKLECQLYKNDPSQETKQIDISLSPGTMVFFNGDKLWHKVTPLGNNERRVALTMEFLTNTEMNPFGKFISNMKDSIAYFGFKQVFRKK